MVSRFFLTLTFFFIFNSTLNAKNILERVVIRGDTLALEFKDTLKKNDFKASAIKKKGLTKYFFDFKNCYLNRRVKSFLHLKGNVKSIRFGQYKKSIVRVVIDSKKSYKVKYYQKEKPVFFITLPNKVNIKNKIEAKNSSPKELFSYVNDDSNSKIKLIETPYSANLKHNYTIMIDPGHGGKDSGTMWGGIKEKTVVLKIARRVYQKLRTFGFKVKMTRYKDYYVTLKGRIKKANKINADLFISIHANATSKKSRIKIAHGIETYFLQNTRNARAKRVAAKENAELLKSMDRTTKQVLLNTVFTGPKIQLSNRLGIDVQRAILSYLKTTYKGIKGNGVRGAPFYVLVGAEMPAILIEVGYLSNPKERKKLLDANYQDKIAAGIVRGIINYLKIREAELE